MLSEIQSQSLKGCTIRIHHPVHQWMESSPFEKVPIPRISMRVKYMGYPLSIACKDIGTYFLNQFPQYKGKRLTPEVYAYIHSIIKTLIFLENLTRTPRLGRLASFIGNWLKKASDPVNQEILNTFSRFRIFSSVTSSINFNDSRGCNVSRPINTRVVTKGHNKTGQPI